MGHVQFGATRFGARNKTGFNVEQNKNKEVQDPNPYPSPYPNPNRYKNDWTIS